MVSDEERKERLDALTELIEMIRPAVQSDGGDLILVARTSRPAWSRSSSKGRAAPVR